MKDREIVLVTGTSKGIGRFLVDHFIKKGAIVNGCSRKPVLWSMPDYTHHIIDVKNESEVKSMFSAIRKKFSRLDITINNAGIASMNHLLLTPLATAKKIFDTNMLGTFLISRESAKLMKKRQYGRIVNFSTIAVAMHLEGEAIYAASKSAVETFTRVIARELAGFGITCNAIGPSPIETDLIRKIPPEIIQRLLNRLPIKKLGSFEDVANVIDFFVRPESSAVTGQVVYLGGA